MTCSVLALPFSGVGGESLESADSEEVFDFTETIRGATFATAVAGIGCVVASSHAMSEAMESRTSDGVIDAMV